MTGKQNDAQPVVKIDMNEHMSANEFITVAAQERFAMPPVVVAALRQAGKGAVLRLLKMIEDDKKMDKLSIADQLKVINLVMDRAYGKGEAASAGLNLLHRTGGFDAGTGNMADQLDAIEKRMEERAVKYPEMRERSKQPEVSHKPLRNEGGDDEGTQREGDEAKTGEVLDDDFGKVVTLKEVEARVAAHRKSRSGRKAG